MNSLHVIPLSHPSIGNAEKTHVLKCLESEWISSGGLYVKAFEDAVARYVSVAGAVATVNGTAALHTALMLAGVQPGEAVLVPALTFIAPINTVRYLGAQPVFVDCDDYLNMDVEKLEAFLETQCTVAEAGAVHQATGSLIRAVVPVHVFGGICDMGRLLPLAAKYRLTVIEDASEALGSTMTSGPLAGKHAGTMGEYGCYSFNGNKILTCGGGGMLLARQPSMLARAKYLTTQAKDDELHYIHHEIGYNYRLTALQAAMGVAQMERLTEFVQIKRQWFLRYRDEVNGIPGLRLLDAPPYCESNHWFFSLMVDETIYGIGRDALIKHFQAARIQVRPIWKLNHTQRPYMSCYSTGIEKAQRYFDQVLNIPCSVGLTEAEFNRVIQVLRTY